MSHEKICAVIQPIFAILKQELFLLVITHFVIPTKVSSEHFCDLGQPNSQSSCNEGSGKDADASRNVTKEKNKSVKTPSVTLFEYTTRTDDCDRELSKHEKTLILLILRR